MGETVTGGSTIDGIDHDTGDAFQIEIGLQYPNQGHIMPKHAIEQMVNCFCDIAAQNGLVVLINGKAWTGHWDWGT